MFIVTCRRFWGSRTSQGGVTREAFRLVARADSAPVEQQLGAVVQARFALRDEGVPKSAD